MSTITISAHQVNVGDFVYRGNQGLKKVTHKRAAPWPRDGQGKSVDIILTFDGWHHVTFDKNATVEVEK